MKRAMVLMNMGGPNNLNEVDVFLKNMFNDKYIIGAPQPIRSLIGYIIRKKRLKEATNNYKMLGGVSPIVGNTKRLIRRLKRKTKDGVFYVMRYTPPFSKDIIQELKNYDEIYAIPMYPHYSSTTTKSSIEDLLKEGKKYGLETKIKTIDNYNKRVEYNNVIVKKIKEKIKENENSKDFTLIFSAHGLPQRTIDKGDPYQKQIEENVEEVKKLLKEQNIEFNSIELAYQSRLGPMEWIKPYLEDKLEEIKEKNDKVIIYPIAFTIDNSETNGELGIEYREVAEELGIKDYRVCEVVNYDEDFQNFILQLYKEIIENSNKINKN